MKALWRTNKFAFSVHVYSVNRLLWLWLLNSAWICSSWVNNISAFCFCPSFSMPHCSAALICLKAVQSFGKSVRGEGLLAQIYIYIFVLYKQKHYTHTESSRRKTDHQRRWGRQIDRSQACKTGKRWGWREQKMQRGTSTVLQSCINYQRWREFIMSSRPGGGCYIIPFEALERFWGDAEEKSSLPLAPGWGVKENVFSPIHSAVMASVSSGSLRFRARRKFV